MPMPEAKEHVVRAGESLYLIGWIYDLDYYDIAEWNGIRDPYVIHPGQKLRLSRPAAQANQQRQPERQAAGYDKTGMAEVADLKWQWPARGKPACRYLQGLCRKGIYIRGGLEQPIVSAAEGSVVYSGTGVKNYGALVIIKHPQGYFSAYANNQKLLVKEGEKVSAGQQIATMGATVVDYPALYFQVRLNGKLLNPLKVLPERSI